MLRMLLAVALLLLPVVALAESAEEMLSACRKLADAPVSGDQVRLPSDFDSGLCWGAFASIQSAIKLQYTDDTAPILRVCAPPSSRRTQLLAIFAQYARNHPERLHEDFFKVAWFALRDAFSCK